MTSPIFTPDGYKKLQEKYKTLEEKRPLAVEQLKKAREMGDLSENGFYKAARFELSGIDRELRHTKHLLKIAQVEAKSNAEHISIGSTVTISDGTKQKIYTIVGSYESNPSEGKISHHSPLGKALIGKKIHDICILQLPHTTTTYTILQIS